MLINIILLLLIILLSIYTTITTSYKDVKNIVVTQKRIKTGTSKRKAPVPSHFAGEEHWEEEKL